MLYIHGSTHSRMVGFTEPRGVQREQACPGCPFAAREVIETCEWLCMYQVIYGATAMHNLNSPLNAKCSFSSFSSCSAISVLAEPGSAPRLTMEG
jgi:hypothetical protein